jgi:hypothetical protein
MTAEDVAQVLSVAAIERLPVATATMHQPEDDESGDTVFTITARGEQQFAVTVREV